MVGPAMVTGGGGASTLYDNGSTHRSGKYKSGDSMMYHGSMFLKRLSDVHGNKSNEHQKHGWRDKLGHFLESKPEQWFIFALICIDLLVIFVQLFVIEPHVNCHPLPTPPPNTTDPTHAPTQHAMFLFNDHSEATHMDPYEEAEWILKDVSLFILSILALEIVLLLVAFDIQFFKQPLYILDMLVIAASLTIEATEGKVQDMRVISPRSMANLLMIFRLWRIVRIIHGIAMSVQERSEEHIKELEAEIEKLSKEKTHVETKFDYLKKRYKKLADAHEEVHFNKDVIDNEELLGNTPRPESFLPQSSLPPFESPGAPHPSGNNTRLDKKKIRINTADLNDNSDDDGDDAASTGHRSITINDEVRDVRRPLVDKAARPNNEYSTFKGRRNQ